MPYTEAPFSVNFKPATGYDAPLLTIRAETVAELAAKLGEVETAGIYAQIGGAQHAFKASYEMADKLDAQHMSTGMQTPEVVQQVQQQQAPPAPQAQQGYAPPAPNPQQPYQQPPQAPYQQQQAYQQPVQNGYAAAGTPPAPPAPQTPGSVPGAPMTPFGPAKLVSGTSAKGTWQAFADPRPKQATDHIQQKTDNPQDPGLAAGTHKFWAWVR